MVKEWSRRRSPTNLECKSFLDLPALQLKDWTWAWQWSSKKKSILKYKHSKDSDTYYCIPGGNETVLKNKDCKNYFKQLENGWRDFDSYKGTIGSLHYIQFEKDNWLNSRCFCQHWMKNYFCHHVVFIAVTHKLVEFADIHQTVPIGKTRSVGRPKEINKKAQKSSSESEASTSDSEKIEKQKVTKKRGRKPKINLKYF